MFHVEHRKNYRKQKIMKSIMRRAAVLVAVLTLPALLTVGCSPDDKPTPPTAKRATVTLRADNPGPSLAAIDACQGLTGQMVAACVILGDRPAETSGDVTNPDGIALVGECRGDTALAEDELYACLTQPHLS